VIQGGITFLSAEDVLHAACIRFPQAGVCQVLAQVADATGVSADLICGPSRRAQIVRARHMFCLVAQRAGFSLADIGRAIDRDHGTVAHAIRAETARRREVPAAAEPALALLAAETRPLFRSRRVGC
jgi:chromosomal replication initiation ATPase DnaA